MNVQGGGGRGRRRAPMAEINVVPYIDVSLVLLIIFMITTPLLQSGVDVDLPKAEAKTIDPAQDPPVIISITADGRLFVDDGSHDESEVDMDGLIASVMSALQDKPQRGVLIRGDKAVDYGHVVTTMAMLKRAGVASVGLMTNPVEE
jgi:biopolymer transport protein TolR